LGAALRRAHGGRGVRAPHRGRGRRRPGVRWTHRQPAGRADALQLHPRRAVDARSRPPRALDGGRRRARGPRRAGAPRRAGLGSAGRGVRGAHVLRARSRRAGHRDVRVRRRRPGVGRGVPMTEVAESSRFVDNDGVRIHALDNGRVDASLPPVLVVPGMGEYADEYTWLLDSLGERRVVVVDVRGRGRSDVPDTGYRWEDHIGDLHAVVEATGLDRPVVVAFSRGSSYALGYALEHPTGLRGLVIGDYFARHVGLPEAFAEQQLRSKVRG